MVVVLDTYTLVRSLMDDQSLENGRNQVVENETRGRINMWKLVTP